MVGSKLTNKLEILLGDAGQELSKLPADSVDLLIADPPYNLGKDYGNNSDQQERWEYLEFSKQWLQQAHRVLKPTGTLYVFMGVRYISYLFQILQDTLEMRLINWICWHYTQGIGKTRGFSPRHEDILMFSKSDKPLFNLDEIRIPQKYYRERNNMRGANPGDVWQFSHIHYCNENRQPHPTQKPEGLMERMVLASSNEGHLVVDPFSGSGTTLRVCQQLNRNCLGIEINPNYISMIQERLAMPFVGFDSIDPRMERVPLDLRKEEIRKVYLKNHEKWFLSNHQNAVSEFRQKVERLYGQKKSLENYRLFQEEIWFEE